VNDVLNIPAADRSAAARHQSSYHSLKVTVPIATTLSASAKYRNNWLVTSSDSIRPGDVIVEV